MNAQPTGDRYLKFKEVQGCLGVSRSTIWRWTTEKGLKVVRIGNVARIKESDLQNFLARHQAQPGNEATDESKADS
jgi:excisionase family DNA binding protein